MGQEKLDYRKTFVLGLGFFSVSIVWPVYNSFVPIMLENYIKSTTLIGAVMTIDNLFAVIFQPIFGALSDKTNTRFGRRMPYLLIGVPLAAIFCSLIPSANSLPMLMTFVILMNFAMSIFRAPTVALMPDVTPSHLRSKANGVINFMGGLAAVIAYGLGGFLYKKGTAYPFYMSSIIMTMALILLYIFIKEPEIVEEKAKVKNKEKDIDKSKSLLFILFAIFFWFTGFNAVETFFSLYGQYELGIDPGKASMILTSFSLSFLIFAIPAGFVGTKLGRKKTILLGIVGALTVFTLLIFIKNISAMIVLLIIGGMFWAFININSYPMVVEMAPKGGVGTYTGYYYFFSSCAAIVSPILFGWIRDMAHSYKPLFIYSCIAFGAALFCMLFVKHGDFTNKNYTEEDLKFMKENI
ncbi:SLC45 family MFS transporter [Sporanaerobacter acetigenes]|uniref:SLC45 family MFS transporter n=1 Tax=Sporanaerobacter acetigenes TaxID=165813 RepID=UPI00331D6898